MSAEVFSILRLALLALKWIAVWLFFLLWRREYCGNIFHRAFFFFGVEHSVAEITAVPCSSLVLPAQRKQHYRSLHFLGVGLSVVNLRSAILWHWEFCFEFGCGDLFFFGVESSAPEITAAPCTSLVLASSVANSAKMVCSSTTNLQGWNVNQIVTQKAVVKWKKHRGEFGLLGLFSGGCVTTAIWIAK